MLRPVLYVIGVVLLVIVLILVWNILFPNMGGGPGGVPPLPLGRQCTKCNLLNTIEPDAVSWTCERCGTFHWKNEGKVKGFPDAEEDK